MKYYATRDTKHDPAVDGPFAWIRIWRSAQNVPPWVSFNYRWSGDIFKHGVIEEYKLPYAPEFLRDMRPGEIREVNVKMEVTPK